MSKEHLHTFPEVDPEKQRIDALAKIERMASAHQKLDRVNILRYAVCLGYAFLAARLYLHESTRSPFWGAFAIFIGVVLVLFGLILWQNRIDSKRSARQIEIMRAYVEKTYNLQTGKEKGWPMHVCRVPGAQNSTGD